MKIEATDLESALILASKSFKCSIRELDYKILQRSSKGFFGFFKKNAIIEVSSKRNEFSELCKLQENKISKEKKVLNLDENCKKNLEKIRFELENLLKSLNLKLNLNELKMHNLECVFIHINGEDSALLIGKEGAKYKAFYYLLRNWLKAKFKLSLRLEIDSFLQEQRQILEPYLQKIITKIQQKNKARTRLMEDFLVQIVFERLRAEFPQKYVGIKQENENYFVVVNDFLKKDETA